MALYKSFFENNDSIKYGREREPEARETYEFITGNNVTEKNFCWRDDRKDCGVSPDGEVSPDGGVEIKCVNGNTLVKYKRMLRDKPDYQYYFQQRQGQMWVMGWEWCDFFVYHHLCGHLITRMYRDDVFIDALASEVEKFNIKFEKEKALLS